MQNDKLKFKKEFERRIYRFALDIILLRSATSIGANVVEAQAATSRKDYTNFFAHALKSANETKFWLGLLQDSGKTKGEPTDKLQKEANEIANILAASILTLKGKR
jgi:four helix bundle protein